MCNVLPYANSIKFIDVQSDCPRSRPTCRLKGVLDVVKQTHMVVALVSAYCQTSSDEGGVER